MSVLTYITSFSIEECRSRLTDPKYASPKFFTYSFTPLPQGTILVKLRGDRFRLFATGPKYIRNSFAPFFYGFLEALPNDTRIHGRFRTHPSSRIFMAIWFGLLGFITLRLTSYLFSAEHQLMQPLYVLFGAPLLMALFGIGLVRLCWWFAEGQRQSMQNFIQNNLLAKPQNQSGKPTTWGQKRGQEPF